MKLSRNFLKRNKFKKTTFSQKIYFKVLKYGYCIYLIEVENNPFHFNFLITEKDFQPYSSSLFELLSLLNKKKLYHEEKQVTIELLEKLISFNLNEMLKYIGEKLQVQLALMKL